MIEINDKSQCSGCEACKNICPKNCIEMKEDDHGFRYPVVQKDICINCHKCEFVCPMHKDGINVSQFDIYAIQNKNENIRKQSSSGGIFSLIANEVIHKNGIVYGAIWDKDLSVKHTSVKKIEDLYKLRGSKYIQSHINDIYKDIENNLNLEQIVLFSGTGCQIAGLKNYLSKEYSNLFTVEIVCHGMPSEMIFRNYIKNIEKKRNKKIKSINFRNKIEGWSNYHISFFFDDDTAFSERAAENDFMNGYIQNLYLRPSCKVCPFKLMKSGSDILLGDFWGVDQFGEPWNDNAGTSVVFIHSDRGRQMIEKIRDKSDIMGVKLESAIQFNPCIGKPVANAIDIYEELLTDNFHNIVDKYKPKEKKITLLGKIKINLKKIIRR